MQALQSYSFFLPKTFVFRVRILYFEGSGFVPARNHAVNKKQKSRQTNPPAWKICTKIRLLIHIFVLLCSCLPL